jgi:NAD(P)-dependent dehydrogenase (short-subunit alcohol dehydrogenase family)/acyl carrier protein
VGNLWLAGVVLDWSAFYAHEPRRRVPLPTYPFERARYWVDAPVGSAAHFAPKAAPPAIAAKRPNMADWFYVPTWKRRDLPGGDRPQEAQCWLLFADMDGLAAALGVRLRAEGHTAVTVTPGEAFAALSLGEYQIDPAAEADYRSLLADLRRRNLSPDRVVHLWNANRAAPGQDPGAVEDAQDCAFYSLLYLAQALAEPQNNRTTSLEIVASGLCDVLGNEPLAPARATLLGPGRVIAQELRHIASRVIDIVLPAGVLPDDLASQLLAELRSAPQESAAASIVALRGRHRWVQDYEQLPLSAPARLPGLLRPHGVYLITGGLGGLGLAFAELLAQTLAARLVLTSRTPLPPRDEWETWLVQRGEDDPTRRKIAAVQALEALGAEVLVVPADVTDAAQMAAAVAATRSAFGPIDGVIHAAGVAGGGIIPLKTRATAADVLAPKVMGTAVLAEALADEPLRFMVLCSSFNAMLGGVGQVDYTAANAYLDAFAQAQARCGGPSTISINWGTWQEAGMAVDTPVPEQWRQVKEENLRMGLRTAEGQEALLRVLANPLPQWVVSPQDLHELQARSIMGTAASVAVSSGGNEQLAASTAPGAEPDRHAPARTQASAPRESQSGAVASIPARHARPPLPTPYAAPCTELETQLAEVWEQLFGIEQIGRNDNFFELGGHSLLATQILVRLQERFGVDLPVRTIFEAHTIAELAARLDVILWAADNQRLPAVAGGVDREEVEF